MQHKILKKIRATLTSLLVAPFLFSPQTARADSSREFLMSCAYGVLAGTLVGAASLAFTEKPGENLNNIARGASLGLYAGIFLGLYVVYGVSSEEEQAIERQTQGTSRYRLRAPEPKLLLQPVWTTAGSSSGPQLTGALAQLNVWRF